MMEENLGGFFFFCLSFAGHGVFFITLLGCTVHFAWDGWMGESKMGEGRRGKLGGMGYDLE
jgi:hypothetical protein